MTGLQAQAFFSELTKIAGIFGSGASKASRRLEYHFSPRAGPDRWAKFVRNSADPEFVSQVATHAMADGKLILHAQAMYELSKGKVVGKIKSTSSSGKTYEIRSLPSGRLGCTCNDWRFKSSVTPDRDCKHIKAFLVGKTTSE